MIMNNHCALLLTCTYLSLVNFLHSEEKPLTVEAEDGTNQSSILASAKASNGKYLFLRKENSEKKATATSSSYEFTINKTGCYGIKFYKIPEKPNRLRISVEIDNFKRVFCFTSKVMGPIFWEKGKHVISIHQSLGDVKFDKFEISPYITPAESLNRYPVPPVFPPNEHPRVLVRKKDIAMIKERILKGDNKLAFHKVQVYSKFKCDGLLSKDLTALAGNIDEEALKILKSKAFMYLLYQDPRMGREAVAGMKNIFNTVIFLSSYIKITRSIGSLIYNGALVYDWCYDLLTEEEKLFFVNKLEFFVTLMEIGYPPYGGGSFTTHTGEAQLFRDALSASIAIYDEKKDLYRMVAGKFFHELVPARNFIYKSGRHIQGDSYGPYRYKWEILSAWIIKRMAGIDVYNNNQRYIPYAWLYMRCPDGQLLRDGDTFKYGSYWKFQESLLFTANYYSDPVLKGELERQQITSIASGMPVEFLLINNPNIKSSPLEDLPLTRYFPEPFGAMICRTGWNLGSLSKDVVVEMKGDVYHFGGHDHRDAGSFQVYYRGYLAADAGIYSGGYSGLLNQVFSKSTIAHNAMLVYDPSEKVRYHSHAANDGGQRAPNQNREATSREEFFRSGYKISTIKTHDFGPNKIKPLYGFLEVDLSLAYTEKVERYERTFCFLNLERKENPATLIVLDKITSSNPEFKKIWLINSIQEPDVNDNMIDIKRTEECYNGRLVDKVLLPRKNNLEISKADYTDGIVDVFGLKINKPLSVNDVANWRIGVSPVKSQKKDVFLNQMQIMDATNTHPLESGFIEKDGRYQITIADWCVCFPVEDSMPLSMTLNVTPEASNFLFSGLNNGFWTVKTGDNSELIFKVDNNVLYLNNQSGISQLSYSADGKENHPDYSTIVPSSIRTAKNIFALNKDTYLEIPEVSDKRNQLMPTAFFIKSFGGQCDLKDGELSAELNNNKIKLRKGDNFYKFNEKIISISSKIKEGPNKDLLLPLRSISRICSTELINSEVGNHVYCTSGSVKGLPMETRIESFSCKNNSQRALSNMFDNDLSTNWACQSNPVLDLDLGLIEEISKIGIAWHGGLKRENILSIELSEDKNNWTQIFNGKSKTLDRAFTFHVFPTTKVRFIKFRFKGNNESDWVNIAEIKVFSK